MLLKKEFYFIRHGQTDSNLNPFVKRNVEDIPLNETGIVQAHAIEPLIATLPVKNICFSPLKRAKQTKDICCSRLGSIAQHELSNLSECTQQIWKEMTGLGPSAISHLEEPVFSFMQKVRIGVNEALSKEGPVLIVAHGGIHWAICCFMQVEHDWVIDNCVPVHFSVSTEGLWKAKKLA